MTGKTSRRLAALAACSALVMAACGGDDSSTGTTPATAAPVITDAPTTDAPTTDAPVTEPPATEAPVTEPPATEPPATEPPAEPIQILVTNDDGVAAPGIDALVQGLLTLEDVVVTVVAPAENQSGSGGSTTDGALAVADATTASGYPAKAVTGFPADTIVWAIDQGGIDFVPDLVIAGINSGQNIGSLVDISGTVGAARAAANRNIPAIAVSAGIGTETVPDNYADAVEAVLGYLTENVADIAGHEEGTPVEDILSINVPTCTNGGEVRGSIEIPLAPDLGDGVDFVNGVDCNSTKKPKQITDDVDAFVNGFIAFSSTPLQPATTG